VKNKKFVAGMIVCLVSSTIALHGQNVKPAPKVNRLDSVKNLELVNGNAEIVDHHGRRAVHFVKLPDHPKSYSIFAIISDSDFKDGTIEVDIAGSPGKDADAANRGFIGLAFRVQDHGARSEIFYLRPTNGRADDQLRRNHSVQYESEPDFPWNRLRAENPGVYESYADLEPDIWTRMKIVVTGQKAQLYINGASQPCLIVNDLKLGEAHGPIALWAEGETDAYFSNLIVR
jgi:hypothetical protein